MYLLRVEQNFDGGDVMKVIFEGEYSVNKPLPEQASSMLTPQFVGTDGSGKIKTAIVDVRLLPVQQQLHLELCVCTCNVRIPLCT